MRRHQLHPGMPGMCTRAHAHSNIHGLSSNLQSEEHHHSETNHHHLFLTGTQVSEAAIRRCDFYFGHERILSHPISLIGQKDSPLIPVFNKRRSSSASGPSKRRRGVGASQEVHCESSCW
ncbi:hypothetical protein E2C01_044395 [Portunus trituberculatus]|uniref:Uncharacterized protein n=1 Tax=Portunus trituberculatus TaxID=210409 RepID=A0A5B7FYC3_PORTR|nr:hypothetical protein [Portunus trituberculatus]